MSHELHFLDPNPQGSPAVLLLHGLGANAESWTFQSEALAAAGYRPLPVDVPGFGRSPYDGRGWSFSRMADLLADWLQTRGLTRVHVTGISMGGVLAQQLALSHPQVVDKLVLINTFAVLRPASLDGWLYFLARAFTVTFLGLEQQAHIVAKRIFPLPEQREAYEQLVHTISSADPRAYRAAMRALGLYDSRKRLPTLPHQTLVVTAENDTTVPPQRQRLLVDLIPNARQVTIPQAGHGVIVEKPEAVNKALLDFFSQSE